MEFSEWKQEKPGTWSIDFNAGDISGNCTATDRCKDCGGNHGIIYWCAKVNRPVMLGEESITDSLESVKQDLMAFVKAARLEIN